MPLLKLSHTKIWTVSLVVMFCKKRAVSICVAVSMYSWFCANESWRSNNSIFPATTMTDEFLARSSENAIVSEQ